MMKVASLVLFIWTGLGSSGPSLALIRPLALRRTAPRIGQLYSSRSGGGDDGGGGTRFVRESSSGAVSGCWDAAYAQLVEAHGLELCGVTWHGFERLGRGGAMAV